MLEVLERTRIKTIYLHIIKTICSKAIAKTKLNGKPLKKSTKIRDRTSLNNISLYILYSIWISSHNNKASKGDQVDIDWKLRNPSVVICRWYDSIHKWSYNFYQRTTAHLMVLMHLSAKWLDTKLTQINSPLLYN